MANQKETAGKRVTNESTQDVSSMSWGTRETTSLNTSFAASFHFIQKYIMLTLFWVTICTSIHIVWGFIKDLLRLSYGLLFYERQFSTDSSLSVTCGTKACTYNICTYITYARSKLEQYTKHHSKFKPSLHMNFFFKCIYRCINVNSRGF